MFWIALATLSMYFSIQLIYEAVHSRFIQLSMQSSTFLEKLVVLHLAYAELEPQLQQFQQLVSLSPKIVSSVYKALSEDSDFKNEISVSIFVHTFLNWLLLWSVVTYYVTPCMGRSKAIAGQYILHCPGTRGKSFLWSTLWSVGCYIRNFQFNI